MVNTMNSRYRGMFLLDALFGTMIAVTVTSAVVVVVAAQNRGAARLAESRSEIRALEGALIQLQSGGRALEGVNIHRIDTAAAPSGWVWAEATTGTGARAMTLRGLIPAEGGAK
jgi:hypothetical protein